MDEPGTVFCLVPESEDAHEIVDYEANSSRRRVDPNNVSRRFLRIGLDQTAKISSRLVTFGRLHFTNDIILHEFPNTDQCYFDFHPITGELLLHDISKNDDTQLFKIGNDNKKADRQICTSPRQCVVLLDNEWIFQINKAEFRLIPRRAPTKKDSMAFAAERIAFVKQIPDEFRTFDMTIERFDAMGLQSDRTTTVGKGYNLRRRHPDGLRPGEELRCVKRALLGRGAQGVVHRVVHLETGDHYAQKTIHWNAIPEWNIYNESDYKARLLKEVNLVKKAAHPSIVPYLFHQGWEIGKEVKIFMPVYDGNLHTLSRHLRDTDPQKVSSITEKMLHPILSALDHVHQQGIIHRDIKPGNILFRGEDFFLTDFGVAKFVDRSVTLMGTVWYAAPEILLRNEQSAKVDIYSLGATLVDCFGGYEDLDTRYRWQDHWEEWHRHLQSHLGQHARQYASMLADTADQRPTARWLLERFFSLQTLQNRVPSTVAVPPPLADQVDVSMVSATRLSLFNKEDVTIIPAALAIHEDTTMVSAAPSSLLSQVDVAMISAAPTTHATVIPGASQTSPSNANLFKSNSQARSSPKTPRINKSTQPKDGRSVKSMKSTRSTDEKRRNGHKRNAYSQNGNPTSQPTGVVKRKSRKQRSSSRSVQNG